VAAVSAVMWLTMVTKSQKVPAHFDEITWESEGP
jgi:hypothetical protein